MQKGLFWVRVISPSLGIFKLFFGDGLGGSGGILKKKNQKQEHKQAGNKLIFLI